MAITTSPIRAMLYDSPHAQEGLGQELGGSVMAPQSDTSSLYVLVCSLAGTSWAWPQRGSSWLTPLCSRWSLKFSLLNNMLCHQSTYRGYTIGVECKGSIWLITASPKTADLPILHCYCSKATAQSETDAIAEAKYRVDRVLAAPLSTS